MSTTRTILTGLTLIALTATGCTPQAQKVTELTEELTAAKRQIVELQETNARLWQEVETIKTRKPTPPPMDAVEKLVEDQMQGIMSNKIAAMVQTEFQKQVGTQDDIEAIFQDTLSQQMAEAEAREDAAREERRTKWRQEQEERRQRHEQQRVDAMAKELGLNDEQKEQYAEIRKENSTKMREAMTKVWNEKGMDVNAMRETRAQVTEENNARMREVMTDDQYQSYTNSQAKRYGWIENVFNGMSGGTGGRGRRSGGGSSSTPAPPPPSAIQVR